MKLRTVLSMEQALSLPYATLRFAQLGWRVIRIEAAGSGGGLPGDPNRYIGSRMGGGDDRRSYFIAPNVGKEAIALNLKDPRGQQVLQRLIQALNVDVFCCNTVPSRYQPLGIDYATLRAAKPDLVWAGISAQGPQVPDAPGYDPVIQAMAGYMEVTGDPNGPPMLTGIPVIDLKSGDELYSSVLLALLERAETGQGREIHVSMLQVAASWLITLLPLLDMGCADSEVTRSGNEHRKFIPTNVYPTRDGFVYLAIGSDVQWQRLTAIPQFASVANAERVTNEGRGQQRDTIYRDMAAATMRFDSEALLRELAAATIPATRILDVAQVRELLQRQGKLTRTTLPDAGPLRLPPMAVDLPGARTELSFPPHYGAHTHSVLSEAGYSASDIAALVEHGVLA